MMHRYFLQAFCCLALAQTIWAQGAIETQQVQEKDRAQKKVEQQQEKKAQHTTAIEFRGEKAFSDKDLRSQLKEQIATIDQYGLTAARGDDVAFFLELFYRKHGYARVTARYRIEAGDRLVLDIDEGPLVALGVINFVGNQNEPTEKLFDYAVGPTRERYSQLQKQLPFVAGDVEEGADLVHRYYISDGFLDAKIDPPVYHYSEDGTRVDATIAITEGRKYSFGDLIFSGQTIYGPEALRGQVLDLLNQPYTDSRVSDIPRRLQTYFKRRGYFDVKISATGDPANAQNGRVPVSIAVASGPLYHFGSVTVTGLSRLHPAYLTNRFRKLNGKTYSPDVVDEKFREMMKTGLFNILQIKPTPIGDDTLQIDISAEEAKSKEFGLSLGYGTYTGAIVGAQYRDRDIFGYGRPVTTSVEYSQRGYKAEIDYDDPYLFESEISLSEKLYALTFDFDGYSKFETGNRLSFTHEFTKKYQLGLVLSERHVEVTSASILPEFLGRTSYFVSSIGFTQTLDLRDSKVDPTRGFIFDSTFDVAANAIGSQVEFVRGTTRMTYFQPLGAPPKPGDPDRRTLLAFGARAGIIHPLDGNDPDAIPIDERFFNGGANTVRSFGERDLGPNDRGNPTGGEFYTIWNVEYLFPIFGELQGAVFFDAGNLLPSASDPFTSIDAGLSDMRYAIGAGLRYKLPIGPIRLDYGYNPDRRPGEDFGAFHFSFGFAF